MQEIGSLAMSQGRNIFIVACLVMWFENGVMAVMRHNSYQIVDLIDRFVGDAMGISILSIPIWSAIGMILAPIMLFLYGWKDKDKEVSLNRWQRAALGIIAGIVTKPFFDLFS